MPPKKAAAKKAKAPRAKAPKKSPKSGVATERALVMVRVKGAPAFAGIKTLSAKGKPYAKSTVTRNTRKSAKSAVKRALEHY